MRQSEVMSAAAGPPPEPNVFDDPRFGLLAELVPQPVFTADPSGAVTWCNDRWTALTGQPPGEAGGRGWVQAVHPDDRPRTVEAWARSLETGEPFAVEHRVRAADGGWRRLRSTARPHRDAEGRVAGWCGTATEAPPRREAPRPDERALRGLFESAAVGVTLVGLDGRPIEANPRLCEMLGYTPEELRRLRFDEFTHPDDVSPDRSAFGELLAGARTSYRLEKRYRRKDGAEVPVRISVAAVPGDTGRTAHVVVVVEDLSERQRAEAALRRTAARFESILSVSVDALITTDGGQRITFFNQGAEAIFGYRAAEVLGQPLDVLLPTHLHDSHRRHFDAFATGGVATRRMGERPTAAVVGRRRDGTVFPAEVSISKVTVGDEVVYSALLRDITDRKRAEAALRESEARLAEAQRIARLGDWSLNVAAGTLDGSDQVHRIFGRAPGDTSPTYGGFLRCVHPADRDRVAAAVDEALETGAPFAIDHRIVRPDGVERVVHLEGVVAREGGVAVRLVGTVQDITEWWRAERALEESEHRLARAQKLEAVGRLAGGIAHDFNNLLTVIRCNTDLVLAELEPDDPLRVDLDEIQAAADRAAALTRQLLAFSRRQVLKPSLLDANEVVADLEKMLQRLIGEDVELRCAPMPGLSLVRADRAQLEQVVVNLVMNARDAMPEGGRITVSTAEERFEGEPSPHADPPLRPGTYVRLTVEDTGAGMDTETLARAFEPFFTTKSPGKGTGLGLSTVYGIVRQSDGYVRVTSERGRGARFDVYLPRAGGRLREQRARAPAAATRGTETVLVVEDEAAVRGLVRRTLEACGYTVHEAPDGTAALALHATLEAPVDLLLTDVVMPGMSGRALADALTARQPGLRVLYTTGYTEDAVVDRGVLRQGVRLLDKPFTPRLLANAVRLALDEDRPGDEAAGASAGAP